MTQNGKGDTPRPLSVSIETYKNNWERIFKQPPTNTPDNDTSWDYYSGLPSTSSYTTTGEE